MKQLYVISHTHWDREWYMPLEKMVMRLTDLFDNLLAVLAGYPDYCFHMDAQTVVLEDYLKIRPEKRSLVETYIRQGRLFVGPWYLQNDFYLTSGEATVRNLLTGKAITEAFGGRYQNVGYAPDQFGNMPQLPQILSNFGIDNFVFGRGVYNSRQREDGSWEDFRHPSEFLWEGSDGTRALAIHMTYWYNNAQRFSPDIDKAQRLAEKIMADFEGVAVTPYLLLMNGVDHMEAQEDLLPILEKVDERLKDAHIRQGALTEYVDRVRAYVREEKVELPVHKGELRGGFDKSILKGTLSSRVYLKQANCRAQDLLESRLEPLYVMLEWCGAKGSYDRDRLRILWRKLMRNHPHDSICGCSLDDVHDRMEASFRSITITGEELIRRGMLQAVRHLAVEDDPGDYRIALANTLSFARSEIAEVRLDIPSNEGIEGFTLTRMGDEKEIPYEVIDRYPVNICPLSPINLPGTIDCTRFVIRFLAEDLPPYSFTGYRIRPVAKPAEKLPALTIGGCPVVRLENEFLLVAVDEKGRVDVTEKASGRTLKDALALRDEADCGDSYVFYGGGDEPLWTGRFPVSVQQIRQGELVQKCRIRWAMALPKTYDLEGRARSAETVLCPVTLVLTLKKASPVLEIDYEIENKAEWHRLRLFVRGDVVSDSAVADAPFDVIRRNRCEHYHDTSSKDWPNASFAAVEGEGKGVAVLTQGQQEFEHLPEEKALAITLLRATGIISRDPAAPYTLPTDGWTCPGNQCIRTLKGRLGLVMYEGDYAKAFLPQRARALRNPLLAGFDSADAKKFSGGRPAVQEPAIAEIFFRPDKYPDMKVESGRSLLTVTGTGVDVTSLKMSEKGDCAVLRMVNLGEEAVRARVRAPGGAQVSDMTEREGEALAGGLPMGPKHISTLRLDL